MSSLYVNDIVYVSGNYFDTNKGPRWSKEVAKINWKTQSLLGVVKSFKKVNNDNYVNVLWLVDYHISSVLQEDLTLFPKNLRPIIGVIDNFNIDLAEYVNVENKKRKMNKSISVYGMSDRETRLSGCQVLIINNYESNSQSQNKITK